jgi:hypothetical protein
METLGQIIGFFFAIFLLRLAYKLYDKSKYPACGFVSLAGAFIMLCSFPFFQGWAKSFIASKIISELAGLGQQVNTVQETTTEMHKLLDNHQIEIDNHQKELDEVQSNIRIAETNVINAQSDITNQFQQISALQTNLNTAGTNIATQEQELSDVEYWVQNLYSKMTNETFSIRDTNNVLIDPSTNGGLYLFIRLSQVPIAGSVETYARDANSLGEQRTYGGPFIKNITQQNLYGYDVKSLTLSFHYVADTRETNYYRQMPTLNETIRRIGSDSWIVKPLP